MQQIAGLTLWMMTICLAMMAVMDTASVLIAIVTMLTVKLLVGVRQYVTVDGANPNRLDWLGKSLRRFVLHLFEI